MPDDPVKQEEEVKEEITSKEEEVVEETPEETTPEPQETKPEPQIDVEELKKETIRETSQAIVDKISKGLGLTQEEQDKSQAEGLVAPWEKEDRNPKSYKEVAEFSADLAEWKRQQAEVKSQEEAKQAEATQKQTNERWNKYWDEQVEDLINSGKLPKVEDKDNPNDPGVVAKKALYQKMWEVTQERVKGGKQPISSLKEIFYEHYEDPSAQPAGADAPVSLGKKAVSGGDSKDYSYDEIHDQPFEKIIAGSKQ